jgi:hypothetical protein
MRLFPLSWLVHWTLSLTGVMAQRPCATTVYDSLLAQRYPGWQQSRQALERMVLERTHQTARLDNDSLIQIPIVVHIIHHEAGSQPGTGGNLSDQQIRSQIPVLNEDYRRRAGTPGYNTNPVGTDIYLEFYLATCDPAGHPTTGITRTYDAQIDYDVYSEDDVRLKSLAYWPSDQYLNIWVTDIHPPYIGFTQFPDLSQLSGLIDENGPASTDGIVIDYQVFGRPSASRLYGQGRTTTHEIGHWLGLLHTWGDTFCGDDYCEDTPTAETSAQSLDNTCPALYSHCSGAETRNMIENYLDYTPDGCMNIFTLDQKARMREVLQVSPRRRQLVVNSTRCLPLPATEQLTVELYPNPTTGNENGLTSVKVLLKGQQNVSIQIWNAIGQLVAQQNYSAISNSLLTFDSRPLSSGMYFLIVRTEEGEKSVRRFVVLH